MAEWPKLQKETYNAEGKKIGNAPREGTMILQWLLNEHGQQPPLEVDGEWGVLTEAAVRQFQIDHKTRVPHAKTNAVVGPTTWGQLFDIPGVASGLTKRVPHAAEEPVKYALAMLVDEKIAKTTYGSEEYNQLRLIYMGSSEGLRLKSYVDGEKKGQPRTVGYGFFMGDKDGPCEAAKEYWKLTFGSLQGPPSFEGVLSQGHSISKEQALQLFNVVVAEKSSDIRKVFGQNWEKLSTNERLAIEDICYNGDAALVGPRTKLRDCLCAYAENKDSTDPKKLSQAKMALKNAIWEIQYNSNKHADKGIQDRRDAQALLLNPGDITVKALEIPNYYSKEEKEELNKKVLGLLEKTGREVSNIPNHIKNEVAIAFAETTPLGIPNLTIPASNFTTVGRG